jgi:hypothetical protein
MTIEVTFTRGTSTFRGIVEGPSSYPNRVSVRITTITRANGAGICPLPQHAPRWQILPSDLA